LEATLVQLLLRRLDARDVSFLVDDTPLLAVLEQQLAIAGARIDAGGAVAQRLWRLLATLVLHLGAEGAGLEPHTVARVLACVRGVLGCALGQVRANTERERERERDRDRERGGGRERETERQRQTERRETEREREREGEREGERGGEREQRDRETETERQTERERDRDRDRERDRETERGGEREQREMARVDR
jgi:hypothetical protein